MLTCRADLRVVEAVPLPVLEVLGDRRVVPRAEAPRVFLRSDDTAVAIGNVSSHGSKRTLKHTQRRKEVEFSYCTLRTPGPQRSTPAARGETNEHAPDLPCRHLVAGKALHVETAHEW